VRLARLAGEDASQHVTQPDKPAVYCCVMQLSAHLVISRTGFPAVPTLLMLLGTP
jgi:hypothetical protein